MQVINCFTVALWTFYSVLCLQEKCINNLTTADRNIGQPVPINAKCQRYSSLWKLSVMVLLVTRPQGHAVIQGLKRPGAKPQLTDTLQTRGFSVYKIMYLALENVALLRIFQKGTNFIRGKGLALPSHSPHSAWS